MRERKLKAYVKPDFVVTRFDATVNVIVDKHRSVGFFMFQPLGENAVSVDISHILWGSGFAEPEEIDDLYIIFEYIVAHALRRYPKVDEIVISTSGGKFYLFDYIEERLLVNGWKRVGDGDFQTTLKLKEATNE